MDEQELRRQIHTVSGEGIDRASVLAHARHVNARRARRRSRVAIGGVATAVVAVTAGVGIGLSGARPVHQPPAHTASSAATALGSAPATDLPTTHESGAHSVPTTVPAMPPTTESGRTASTAEPPTTRGTAASGGAPMASTAGFAFVSPAGDLVSCA